MPKPDGTQRAYTLRLQGPPAAVGDEWKDRLWTTHIFLNRAAAFWGEVLLAFRAGVPFQEAEVQDPEEKSWRRKICALSWLNVESAPVCKTWLPETVVDNPLTSLGRILKEQGAEAALVSEWLQTCEPCLQARIRDGARWINRFESWKRFAGFTTKEDRDDLIGRILGSDDDFFARKPKDKNQATIARHWLTERFGIGKGSDYSVLAQSYETIAERARSALAEGDAEFAAIRALVANGDVKIRRGSSTWNTLEGLDRGSGLDGLRKLADDASKDAIKAKNQRGVKGHRRYSDEIMRYFTACFEISYRFPRDGKMGDLYDEFPVVLAHAARMVRKHHSWVKLQEQNRQEFATQREFRRTLNAEAVTVLDEYCEQRTVETGASEDYRIRRGAISGWKEVVQEWNGCASADARLAAVRNLQGSLEKFGDARLFEHLASDSMKHAWADGAELLKKYVDGTEAEYKASRFKVPAFRHPDPCLHPIFCEYGKSQWPILYQARKSRNSLDRGVKLLTLGQNQLRTVELRWQSKRLAAEIFGSQEGSAVPRVTRVARSLSATPACHASGVFEPDWNGRLQASRSNLQDLYRRCQSQRLSSDQIDPEVARSLTWFLTFSPQLTPQKPRVRPTQAPAKRGFKVQPHFAGQKIRVLSVDLGIRVAASCSVWQTMSEAEVKEILEADPPPNQISVSVRRENRTTFFRRIAAPVTATGDPHPAGWARLDRQFLVRLPGEDRPARRLSDSEVQSLMDGCPWFSGSIEPMDIVLENLLTDTRRELFWHGNRAKLVQALKGADAGYLARCLAAWLARCHVPDKRGDEARSVWEGCFSEKWSTAASRDSRTALASRCAETLLNDRAQRLHIAERFAAAWTQHDATWPQRLKKLRQVVAPREKDIGGDRTRLRGMGGLSMRRIGNVRALYELSRAFKNRPNLDSLKPAPDRMRDETPFARRLKLIHERLRENRVKVLASRIIEAALGMGAEPKRGHKRAQAPSENPRHAKCDAVVIEDLTQYGTSEVRTRRENRMLMSWSKSKLKKQLQDGCDLYGLRLHQVSPAYTSYFDFRTGVAGERCEFVSRDAWQTPRWKKFLEKEQENKTELARLLASSIRKLSAPSDGILVPQRGGVLFVPAEAGARTKVLHADLNASANIGLRALLDPDWPLTWTVVQMDRATGKAAGGPYQGWELADSFEGPSGAARKKKKGDSDAPAVNVFRMKPSSVMSTGWQYYSDFKEELRRQVLRAIDPAPF
ncbi:MAG: type V CRISPR-associated protein Cas12b [Bryobacteraceae bacterium]|nr:type V CRISPR-associated protein Cas12b [Bryobacteraceae bacterium]